MISKSADIVFFSQAHMINRLVIENLKHRPLRTLLSVTAIGVQVTMVLTLVGLSRGMLQDQADRAKGVGADIVIRPPDSSVIGFSYAMSSSILSWVRNQPHIKVATGSLVQTTGGISSVTGLDIQTFSQLGSGFRFLEGGPFNGPGL
jgi:putative ABC transport system permease protein